MGLPYFPFYPDRWLSSGKIDLLTLEQEGAYIRLLARAWGCPECTLPRDEKILLRWSRLTDTDVLQTLIRMCFVAVDTGYQSPVLRTEWEKACKKHDQAVKNVSARWIKEKHDTDVLQTYCGRNTNQNQNQNHIQKEPKNIYGEYKHVRLTTDQFRKLQERFKEKTEDWIKELDEGIETKGYKYKNHYLAILKWSKNNYGGNDNGRLQGAGVGRETNRERRNREAREYTRKAFGFGGSSSGISPDVHSDEPQRGGKKNMDDKVIDSTAVEIDEAGRV